MTFFLMGFVTLIEPLKDVCLLIGRNADAFITNAHADGIRRRLARNLNRAALCRILDGIIDKVQLYLLGHIRVAFNHQCRQIQRKRNILRFPALSQQDYTLPYLFIHGNIFVTHDNGLCIEPR